MNEQKPLIVVENVSFHFKSLEILKDVSFNIAPGDFLALIGPNGSGKTTLIRIILGLRKPTNGRVFIMDEPVEQFRQWQRIGYVPQKATQFDSYFPASVKEVVAMGLLSQKKFPRFITSKDEAAIAQALEAVDMQELKNRRIGELSGGQQQRVFIARAIVNGPDILFFRRADYGCGCGNSDPFL